MTIIEVQQILDRLEKEWRDENNSLRLMYTNLHCPDSALESLNNIKKQIHKFQSILNKMRSES